MNREPVTLAVLIRCEVADFFAGFGSPGEPQDAHQAQQLLIERLDAIFQTNTDATTDGRADFEAWMLERWGRERSEYDFALGAFIYGQDYADSYTRHMWKAWSASRAAIVGGKGGAL